MSANARYLLTLSVLLVLLLLSSACSSPKIQVRADVPESLPRLMPESVVMQDGYVLPIKTWPAVDKPVAIVLALHGFNDYSNAFAASAPVFAEKGITTYAIDQRGFGRTAQRGIWAGLDVMQSDLVTTVRLLCEKHAGLPLFVIGHSMGGGLILSAVQQLEQTCVRGVILAAPAVWGWDVMPWWQTAPLKMLARIAPGATLTGKDLDIKPSDNVEMLRAQGRDPLVIKETRVDSIYGLTNLMEAALLNSPALRMPALILYGEHDEIIPPGAFCAMLESLPDRRESRWRLVIYPDGYHMLSRDLQGEVVIRDMVVWMHNQRSVLPSGDEVIMDRQHLPEVCRE